MWNAFISITFNYHVQATGRHSDGGVPANSAFGQALEHGSLNIPDNRDTAKYIKQDVHLITNKPLCIYAPVVHFRCNWTKSSLRRCRRSSFSIEK